MLYFVFYTRKAYVLNFAIEMYLIIMPHYANVYTNR